MEPDIITSMPAKSRQMSDAKYEGNQMARYLVRRLPLELLIAIADQLQGHRDIIAFGLTCMDMYDVLVNKRRRLLEIRVETSQSDRTAMTGPKYRLLNQEAAALTFAYHGSETCPLASPQPRGRTSCNCWGAVNSMHAINRLWMRNRYTELTLGGRVPGTSFRKTHPLIPTSTFMAAGPEVFKVELPWTLWDVGILERMFVVNLKSLKLPMSHPSDCLRLGRALTKMPRLMCLAITRIPISHDFLPKLGCIGAGILHCASTLRELDIEMSNCYYVSHGESEADVFRKIFPCELLEKHSTLRERSQLDTGSVVEAPLRLTKLRSKYLDLPWYSFGSIFDATTIKHIRLACSNVDGRVWEVLEKHAQLETLTEIDYDMLSAGMLRLLSRQSSLKELTFVLRQDLFWAPPVISFLTGFGMGYHAPGRRDVRYLGPEDIISSLQHMKMLKHLVLPRDVFALTSRSLAVIAATLTGLEHLELAFDYGNHALQQAFAFHVLCGMPSLKRITFLLPKKVQPDSATFQTFIESLGKKVSANLKLLRYMSESQTYDHLRNRAFFYHRETPLDGEWWMRVPADEGEQIFAEGRTPRVVPVGEWDWEIEAE